MKRANKGANAVARGIFGGMIAGTLVSGVVLGTVSVLTDPPGASAPDAVALEVPAGSEFDPSREDKQADLPAVEASPGETKTPKLLTPEPDDISAMQVAGTAPATQPETGAGDVVLSTPDTTEGADGIDISDETPVLPSPQAVAPTAPSEEGDLLISTEPAQPLQPVIVEEDTAFPATEDQETTSLAQEAQDEAPVAPAEDEIAALIEPQQPALPEIEQDDVTFPIVEESDTEVATVEETEKLENTPEDSANAENATESGSSGIVKNLATQVTTNRLPSVTSRDETGDAEAEGEDSEQTLPASETLTPLQQFAVEFENPDNKPLMSIVLIDDGSSPIGLETLTNFPYPLSFAVDSAWAGAEVATKKYRDAGFEVLVMVNMPETANARDTEVAMQAYFDAVPEAVAVMEGDKTGLQASREVSGQLAPILLDSGHGLVMFPKGLNTAQKLIAKSGVPSRSVFRDFDANGQDAAAIRRFLDKAAFKSRQEDNGIVMVGRLRADTISALLLWGLQDRASRVALAPISAVLGKQ